MKNILILIMLPSFCFSQPRYGKDTLYSSSGYKIYDGLEIKIGTGSTDDGDFKFIRRNSTGFGTIMTTTNNNSYNKDQFSLQRTWAGHKAKVVKIAERGTKKSGYLYQPLISINGVRFEIDVDNAIKSGELDVPSEFKPKPIASVAAGPAISVADELAKLNKLYKDSLLTKEEYETQKKKLLDK